MTPSRHSLLLIRSSLVALLTIVSILPYYAAHWLLQHGSVYYSLASSGRLGLFITNTAEMINIASAVPFITLGLLIGVILARTLRFSSLQIRPVITRRTNHSRSHEATLPISR